MIGKIIKTMRRENNLTQEELSKKIFLGRTTLSDYEREKKNINFETIEKLQMPVIMKLHLSIKKIKIGY